MGRKMALEEYGKALKEGQREYKECIQKECEKIVMLRQLTLLILLQLI